MKTPNIKQNPHPKMRYEITLTAPHAPGTFESVTGFMQYEVANEECAPKDTFAGVFRKPPIQQAPIVFARTSDGVYTGTVYLDLMQDEDYYGLGVCHWSLVAAIARLKIGEVTFSPDLSPAQIVAQRPITTYFPISAYGDNSTKDMHYGGSAMSDTITKYRDEFFPITLTAKESI